MINKKLKFNNLNNRSFIRLAFVVVLILILGFLFLNVWRTKYNVILRYPYVMKGNIFLMLIYMILTYVFMLIYDCNNIHEFRIANLVFAETVASLSCNILVYFVMIIPAGAIGLMPITPMFFLCVKDFIVIFFWSLITNLVYKVMFSASDMLLITNENSIDETVHKFSKRNDIYNIKEKVIYNDNLNEIIEKIKSYDDILIGDITSEKRNDIIKQCFNNSKNIYLIPKLSDILVKYSDDLFVFDTPIFLSAYFGLSLESQFFKRMFDIVFSIIILLCFLPIWIIIAILIKIEDGGSIFFIQERVTINKKKFNIIKFRSMKMNNDKTEVLPTIENDDRITKIGKFIRKFHIDEIPQLINVLIGDMSIVGPRPERIEHVELYTKEIREFEYRLKVKAGLTGLAQIYGKYNTSAIDKLKLDLIYIKKYSFMFDMELILRTLKVFIMKDNTEGFDSNMQDYIKNNAK